MHLLAVLSTSPEDAFVSARLVLQVRFIIIEDVLGGHPLHRHLVVVEEVGDILPGESPSTPLDGIGLPEPEICMPAQKCIHEPLGGHVLLEPCDDAPLLRI